MATLEKLEWKREVEKLDKTELLLHAAKILNSTLELQELLDIILDLTCRVADSEVSLLLLKHRKSNNLHILTCKGEKKELPLRLGEGLIGWVAEHLVPVISNQPQADPRILKDLEIHLGTIGRSVLAVPILRRGKFLGVLEAINKKEDSGFADADRENLLILAEQVAVALDNSFLYRRVKEESLKKEVLLEIDRKLSSSLELEEVLEVILNSIRKIVDCDAAGIFLINKKTQEVERIEVVGYDLAVEADLNLKVGQGLVGFVAKTGEAMIVPDVRQDSRYVNARLETLSEIVAPIKLAGEVIGAFNLESDQLNAFDEEDLAQLKVFAHQAAISIERARLHRTAMEQKKTSQELSIARQIQLSFLPRKNPTVPGLDIAGTNIPSEQVGGDYYDFIPIIEHQTGLVIGDVSGKGVPAALIMASFRASLLAEIRNNYAIRTILRKVNRLLFESMERDNFVTAIYGVLDSAKKVFTFSNAGHNPPFLLRHKGEVEFLQQGGLALGILVDSSYQEKTITLKSGDLIVFYTDGVTEALNQEKQEFGQGRLIEVMKRGRSLPAGELLQAILEEVHEFSDGNRSDDITVVVVKCL
ncbi:MAG: hypothetical protein A2Z27_01235 [candidate division Zixibacteria bacterium RBG_16_50_21]|nr:MAG: hypothetical protein A2Z27_01235 [candidate division Zixibacteria bacterium RBG_16_50_21]